MRSLQRALIWSSAIAIQTGLTVTSPALADDVLPLADKQSFYEAFVDSAPTTMRGNVVGASIVGVQIENPTRPFDPRDIRITGLQKQSNVSLCVKLISRDGRYVARARYKLDSINDPSPRLEFISAHSQQLARYTSNDVGVLAYSGRRCEETGSLDLYAATYDVGQPRAIVLQLRAGDARVRAQLGQNKKAVGEPVLCARITSGAAIGYSSECRLPLPADAKSGRYQISIGETASSGEVVVRTHSLQFAAPQ